MVDLIKEPLQINIHYPALALGDILPRHEHGLLSTTSRPKSVARIRKAWIKQRAHHLMNRLLDQPDPFGLCLVLFPAIGWQLAPAPAIDEVHFLSAQPEGCSCCVHCSDPAPHYRYPLPQVGETTKVDIAQQGDGRNNTFQILSLNASPVERYAASQRTAPEEPKEEEVGDEADVLLSEVELGQSGLGASGTVISMGTGEEIQGGSDIEIGLGDIASGKPSEPAPPGGETGAESKASQFEEPDLTLEEDVTPGESDLAGATGGSAVRVVLRPSSSRATMAEV